ncbi:hypothetical protein DFP72DRAFT_315640 [Ephemerocybe angulata]|uniref:F-box domain-containing protein n=1 Tax=Ephemerocybe angulata TaxID=980116 RepID=A0A8H6LU99_9AGAR|nr:hypothetical protein DFP72DRAFT_315640 [Tulosesus angulatus]
MPPPQKLSDLVNSNVAPTLAEAALARRVLEGLIEEASVYRARLEASELEVLRLRSVLSPARRLPVEIIGEILLLVTPLVLCSRGRAKLLDLTAVCRHWRQAALLTHRLWGGLSIDATAPESAYDSILSWFSRAGALPKFLYYESRPTPCDCDDTFMGECQAASPLIVHLLSEGPLLEHLKLSLTSPGCLRNAVIALKVYKSENRPRQRPWDNLQSIKLVFGAGQSRVQWEGPIDPEESMFYSLPPVQAFHIHLPPPWSSFTYNDDSRTDLPSATTTFISRLTTFMIKWDCAGLKLFELLRYCVNVETLTIDFDSSSPVREHRHTPLLKALAHAPLTLPKVRTLQLRRTSTEILDYLETPALTSLDISLNGEMRERDHFVGAVSSFLLRSKVIQTVERLRIHALTVSAFDLRTLFSRIVGIRHLTLDDVVFDGLLFVSTTLSTLPLLTELNMLQISVRYNVSLDIYLLHTRKNCEPCNVTVTYGYEPARIRESEWNTYRLTRAHPGSTRISLRVLPMSANPYNL